MIPDTLEDKLRRTEAKLNESETVHLNEEKTHKEGEDSVFNENRDLIKLTQVLEKEKHELKKENQQQLTKIIKYESDIQKIENRYNLLIRGLYEEIDTLKENNNKIQKTMLEMQWVEKLKFFKNKHFL